ncbi:hypothetical protein AB0J68_22385 [Micromonospora sp. NPDC049580]|uniref:hypothetical protein n=1 Tax=Micromonospora sp. NPDC049580 TaxID=3154832 RepID=UPI003438D874
MDEAFWLGLALAVPLSIFANLATGPTQKLLSRYSDSYKARQLERKTKERDEVRHLAPEMLTWRFFFTLFQLFRLLIVGLVSISIIFISTLLPSGIYSFLYLAFGVLVAGGSLMLAMGRIRNAVRQYFAMLDVIIDRNREELDHLRAEEARLSRARDVRGEPPEELGGAPIGAPS